MEMNPSSGSKQTDGVRHVFSVDVEEWFNGIPWPGRDNPPASRLSVGLDRLLELLAAHETRATFFLLGPLVQSHPGLARRLAEAGHEVGCHGWSHDLLYEMSPERFRQETRDALSAIADDAGQPVTSYRAAYFSITERSLWALDILAELGVKHDSSIFPVKNWRYGIPGYSRTPLRIDTPSGPLLEFPISVRRLAGIDLPVSGGAYFRLYPYAFTRANFWSFERERRPVVFYLHPWELDPEHPRVPFDWRARLTHYVNLRSTVPRLKALLRDFRFAPLSEVLEDELSPTRS